MSLKEEALAFLRQTQRICFEAGDSHGLLEAMAEESSWIDGHGQILCREAAQTDGARHQENARLIGCFQSRSVKCRSLSDTVCLVYGQGCAAAGGRDNPDGMDCFTAICIRTEAGMKLAHLHVSKVGQEETVCNGTENGSFEAGENQWGLARSGQDFVSLAEHIPGGAHQCLNDPWFTLITMSNSFLDMFGYSREEIREQFHNRFLEMIYPDDRPALFRALKRQLAQGDTVKIEYRVQRKDGNLLWILDNGKLSKSAAGESLYCTLIDITQQRREQEELRLSLERHQIIMDQAADIIFEWDIEKDTLLFSKNWRKKFGYDPISQRISEGIPDSPNIHPDDMPAFIKIMEDTSAGVPYSETEFRIRDAVGNFIWCRIRATTQYNFSGRPVKAVGVIVDIDVDKRQREILMDQAQRDPLTGLFNKGTVKKRVEEQLSRGIGGALLLIDLDNFKQVNDQYGHLCGDAVLSDTASALSRQFRADDIVGRIGGDEFLAFLPGLRAEKAAEKGKRIQEALGRITVHGGSGVSCSVGAAFAPGDGADYYSLYRCADRALYLVKSRGKGGYAAYEPTLCAVLVPEGVVRSAVGTVIDSDSGSVDEMLGQYSFRMLYNALDTETAVQQILEIVGRAYNVSRAYIFESSEDGKLCSNTFEWCNTGIASEIDHLQNLSYVDDLGDYLTNFDENGIFYCKDTRSLHPDLYKILAPQGICSILQCAIRDDGEFRGYVGFDECRENRFWTKEQIDSLTLIANVLSTFLLKLRFKERLRRIERMAKGGQ